jgi:hypothetical protein
MLKPRVEPAAHLDLFWNFARLIVWVTRALTYILVVIFKAASAARTSNRRCSLQRREKG